jgi:hypothetical protein
MTPLILSSPAKSSRPTGTHVVNVKTISENEPSHQRSLHNDPIWSMEVKDVGILSPFLIWHHKYH